MESVIQKCCSFERYSLVSFEEGSVILLYFTGSYSESAPWLFPLHQTVFHVSLVSPFFFYLIVVWLFTFSLPQHIVKIRVSFSPVRLTRNLNTRTHTYIDTCTLNIFMGGLWKNLFYQKVTKTILALSKWSYVVICASNSHYKWFHLPSSYQS